MALVLSKVAETSTTITLGWTPYAGIECYAFFANGQKVSMADDRNKDGSLRSSVKFSKAAPGPPFNVVALVKLGAGFAADWGQYPASGPSLTIYPSTTRYPSEVI